MFWESVGNGLSVLTNWQTYPAAVLFILISLVPLLAAACASSSRHSSAFSVFAMMVGAPLFRIFALCVFVATLFPIILGISDNAAWELPWAMVGAAPVKILLLVGVLLLLSFLLALVPIFGQIESVYTVCMGGLILVLLIAAMETSNPEFSAKSLQLWPGWLFAVGLIALGSALGMLGAFFAGAVALGINKKFDGFGQVVAAPLASAFGFIPLFVYGAWLGLQLHIGR